ncbi:PAS domain-containing protein [Oceanibacterium hippocampi]|uniref:Uncharacterized protein n=1 Tax=Oceanibacterium hippocampi TaxID=745714 RepID=A0A1Y5SRY3_9PROT|nr:PAS domain-containing protein [Oceanibacterium hippocampi]SLN45561.1 hypothetical protein OCH7691_01963 [Oceanibacterium hippocampi]
MNKLHAYETERPTDTVAANLIRSGLDPDLQIANPILALGLDAWRSLCGARPMPAPKDIDPLMLPRAILPHVLLLDIEQGPPARFRWRLIGTHITQTLGRDCSGCY